MKAIINHTNQVLAKKHLPEQVFLIFLICVISTHELVMATKICGFLLCIYGLFSEGCLGHWKYWLVLALTLTLNVIPNYFLCANHYWLLTYLTFGIALSHYIRVNQHDPHYNIFRSLFMIVFLFATFHKLASTYFISGRLVGDYIIRGDCLYGTFSLLFGESHYNAVQGYISSFDNLSSQYPIHGTKTEIILPGIAFEVIVRIVSIVIAFLEFLLILGLFVKKVFYHRLFPYCILFFVWSTFFFRSEFAFFSLLCILTLFALPDMRYRPRLAFIVSIIVLLSLEVSDINIVF